MNRRTKYPFNTNDYFYSEGGNPPVSPGFFHKDGDRVAWWPAEAPVTQGNMEKVYRAVIARENEQPLSRTQVRAALLREAS